jgi:predicted nucleic acid-binding protein
VNELFLDTAGWACLADRREQFHDAAELIYLQARRQGRLVVTTNYVLAELVTLLTSPKHLPRAEVIDFADAIRAAPNVEVLHVDSALDAQAWQLLRSRRDKEWSLVDCASFVVMQQRKIAEALTTDRNFEQAGFTRLLK